MKQHRWHLVVILAAGAAVIGGVRAVAGLWGPLGSDPQLWGLTALDTTAALVPPLYPSLISLLGVDPVVGGVALSLIAAALAPAATLLASALLGAAPRRALLAGLVVLASAPVLRFGQQLQPDALLVLLLLAAVPILHRRNPVGLVLLAGLAPLLRTHGLVIAAACLLAARSRRVALAVVAAVIFAPLLCGQPPGLPWAHTWSDRVTMTTETVGLLQPLHTLAAAPLAWLWVALGLLSALRQRSWGAAALVSTLPALVILSQPRHVEVAVPAAVALWAAGTGQRGWLLGALLLAGLPAWRGEVSSLMKQSTELRRQAVIAEAVCAEVPPGGVLITNNIHLPLLCPRAFALPQTLTELDCVWHIGPPWPPDGGWEKVRLAVEPPQVYRRRGMDPAQCHTRTRTLLPPPPDGSINE